MLPALLGALLVSCSGAEGEPEPVAKATDGKRSDLCVACHEEHHELWLDGGHATIECVACHGFEPGHVVEKADPRPEMKLPPETELCLSCHGESSRTASSDAPVIPGIAEHVAHVSEKHSVPIDFERTDKKCVYCHDPHSLE